jgi:hypothetical protein
MNNLLFFVKTARTVVVSMKIVRIMVDGYSVRIVIV